MGCCCTKKVPPSPLDKGEPRSCTDIIPLVVFILFWFFTILLWAWAVTVGDPWRLLYGSDSFGNTCGRDNPILDLPLSGWDLRERPYLMAMDVFRPYESIWICVEKCPDRDLFSSKQLYTYSRTEKTHLCRYNVNVTDYANSTFYANTNIGPCPTLPLYRSKPVLNRCVPTLLETSMRSLVSGVFGYLNGLDFFAQVLSDIASSYIVILAMCLFALVLSLIFVLLLRYVASAIVYVIFAVAATASLAATIGVWYVYLSMRGDLNILETATNGTRLLATETLNEHTILVFAIVATLVTAIVLMAVCCCWGSARLVVDLFAEAGRCLASLPGLLFTPFATFSILLVFFTVWIGILLCLATAKTLHGSEINETWSGGAVKSQIVVFGDVSCGRSAVEIFWWYHIVGLIWTAEFILAAQQMVVAGSVAAWYFTRDKRELGHPICLSLGRTFLYHAGSLALGSFIITLVKLPRLVLTYLITKLKEKEGACAGWCLKCCVCCLYGVEKCLRYLHHNAYTIIAMEGQSFCPAAVQAVEILANRVLDVGAINLIGDLLLFLAKFAVTAVVAVVALFLLQSDESLHFYSVPLLLICIFTFFVAHCFFSVYEMTIDTLFLCYCADRDMADRTGEELFADPRFTSFIRANSLALSRAVSHQSHVVEQAAPEEIPFTTTP